MSRSFKLDWCVCYYNGNLIKVKQISLRKWAEIYTENYVDHAIDQTIMNNHQKFPLKTDTIVLLYSVVICQDPKDPSLKRPLLSRFMNDSAQYSCKNSPTSTHLAKCTIKGWTPNPLCQGIFIGDFYLYMYLFSYSFSCIFKIVVRFKKNDQVIRNYRYLYRNISIHLVAPARCNI